MGTCDGNHPAVLEHFARQPFGARSKGQPPIQQRLHHRHTTRHHIADDDHIRGDVQLRGLEPLDQFDTERPQLRAHGRIDVAVGAGDLVAGGLRDGGDAAHERPADSQNMNVHQ